MISAKMDIAVSINKVTIRLTNERWQHISVGHPEMAALYDDILFTIENPDYVYEDLYSEYLAISETGKNKNKYIVVVYKELDKKDGFVITSFITNKAPYFTKKKLIWKR